MLESLLGRCLKLLILSSTLIDVGSIFWSIAGITVLVNLISIDVWFWVNIWHVDSFDFFFDRSLEPYFYQFLKF